MLQLHWKDGALRLDNGTAFKMPTNTAVPVGSHAKGFNKTIGKTLDGSKKRFWLGRDRDEAERKAAHLLNVWELLQQRDGSAAAWNDESLALASRGVHIDKLVELSGLITSATASIASDSASLTLVRGEARSVVPAATAKPETSTAAKLYSAIDAYRLTIAAAPGSDDYRRRRLETTADLKRFRSDVELPAVDRIWLEQLTQQIKARPKSKKTGKAIAPHTVKTYLQHYRQFFDWLDSASESPRFGGWEAPKKWERLFALEASSIMSKNERDKSADGPEQITIAEIKALYDIAKEQQRIILLTAIFTAQGQRELSVTRRDEFDLQAQTFRHRRNKTGQLGVYWLPPELVTALAKHFKEHKRVGDDLAFRTSKGRPLVTSNSDSVRQWFDDLRRGTDVRSCITFYSLRRYFGHRARMIGGSDLQSAALSHAGESVGEKSYSNFRDYGAVAEVGKAIYSEMVRSGIFTP